MRKNAISHALVKYGMVLFVPNPILSQPGLIWRSLIEWSTRRRLLRRPAASITCALPSRPIRTDQRVGQTGNEAYRAHAARARSKAELTEQPSRTMRTEPPPRVMRTEAPVRTTPTESPSLSEPGTDSIAA